MNKKLTYEEWSKLSRDEKRAAILNFTAPDNIYRPDYYDPKILRGDKV